MNQREKAEQRRVAQKHVVNGVDAPGNTPVHTAQIVAKLKHAQAAYEVWRHDHDGVPWDELPKQGKMYWIRIAEAVIKA